MKSIYVVLVGVGLLLGACQKPCPEGYKMHGAKCALVPVRDAGVDGGTDAAPLGNTEHDAASADAHVKRPDSGPEAIPVVDSGSPMDGSSSDSLCVSAACDELASCDDSSGVAVCTCPTGYDDPKGDGTSCVDVDECKLAQDNCDDQADCTNTPGSFHCACKVGFNGDGVNACKANKVCSDPQGSNCDENAACALVQGVNYCTCDAGFEGNGESCADIDECEINRGGCDARVSCTNKEPGRTCGACPTGYSGAGDTACNLSLSPPTITGEASSGHLDLTWTWNTQAGVTRYEIQCATCGAANWTTIGTTTSFTYPSATLSSTHTFRVRACTAFDCTGESSFTTKVEDLTASVLKPVGRTAVWQGVANAAFTRTALTNRPSYPSGHPTAIGCADCFLATKATNALTNAADIIELPVSDLAGVLSISTDDIAPGATTAASLLTAIEGHASNQASLVALNITETSADATSFAVALLNLLNQHRGLIKNGRPLIVIAPQARRTYLTALKQQADAYPFLRTYLRYYVRFPSPAPSVAAWYDQIDAEAAAGFHGVQLHYQSTSLFGGAMYARSKGMAVGLYGVQGPQHGDVVIGTMREDVDWISTKVNAAKARLIVQKADVIGWFNAGDADCLSGSTLSIYRNDTATSGGSPAKTTRTLGVAATSNAYGSPSVGDFGADQDLVGKVLSFSGKEILDLYERHTTAFLMSAATNIDPPTGAGTWFSGDGWFFGSTSSATVASTFSGGNDGVAYQNGQAAPDNKCQSANGLFGGTLNGGDSFVLTYAYDPAAGGGMLANHLCAGGHPPLGNVTTTSGAKWYVGGVGNTNDPLGSYYFYEGHIQQVMIAHWGAHNTDGVNQ